METSSSIFTIRRIDHTGITVARLDDHLGFWVGVFGFKHLYTTTFPNNPFIENVVGVSGAALRLAMLEAPGHFIELLEYTAPDSRTTMKPRSCDVGSVHLAFEVDDLDGILARIKRWGWNPVGTPQTVEEGDRAGLRLAYVRGPDGVTLELPQFAFLDRHASLDGRTGRETSSMHYAIQAAPPR